MRDLENIIEYIKPYISLPFLIGFVVGYVVRLFVGRTKGVYYSIKNLFRLFK